MQKGEKAMLKLYSIIIFIIVFLTPALSQENNISTKPILDMLKILKMNKDEQISYFNQMLGENINVTSNYSITKYKDKKVKKVFCVDYYYESVVGNVVCIYYDDSDRLGHFVLQLSDNYKTINYKVLFSLLNLPYPRSLGKKEGMYAMSWYNFFDYQGFTKVQLGYNRNKFDGIDIYIDRIE